MKRKNPYGIKTPTSVEEFRENLRKYYLCNTTIDGYENIEDNRLMLDVNVRGIELNKISSFTDIYKITKSGFCGDGGSPMVIPKITQHKDILEYMNETDQVMSSDGYFYDEKNYTLWEGKELHNEFLHNGNPLQYSLDNQHLREFYMIALGKYCGYRYVDEMNKNGIGYNHNDLIKV